MNPLVGSNALIGALKGSLRVVVRTETRRGAIYHLNDDLKPIRGEVVERLIGKGVLVAARDSNRAFALSPSWGGQA